VPLATILYLIVEFFRLNYCFHLLSQLPHLLTILISPNLIQHVIENVGNLFDLHLVLILYLVCF
jgi:hypothetical protein